MSLTAVCPGCSAKVTAPDAAAGKKVRCPKCQAAVPVPSAAPEVDDFEVVDEAPAKPKKKPAVVEDDRDDDDRPRKKKPAVVEDAEDEDRPRKKKRVVVEDADEDEDRPRKKRRDDQDEDDEEDDDRPRKKKRRSRDDDDEDEEKAGVSMTRNIIMGTVLLILVGVAVFIFYGKYHEGDDGAKKTEPRLVGPEDNNLKRAGVGAAGK